MKRFMGLLLNMYEGIISTPENIKYLLIFRKAKRYIDDLQQELELHISLLGKEAYKNQTTNSFNTKDIDSLIEKKKILETDFKTKDTRFEQKKEELSKQVSNLLDKISEENTSIAKKSKKLPPILKEIKSLKKSIAKIKFDLAKNEIRKKRVKELKTFIPKHLLDQKKSTLSNKLAKKVGLLKEQEDVFDAHKKSLNNDIKGMEILKHEYKLVSKNLKIAENSHKKDLTDFNKKLNAIEKNLQSEYYSLGNFLAEKENCEEIFPDIFRAINKSQEKILESELRIHDYQIKIKPIKKDFFYFSLFIIIVSLLMFLTTLMINNYAHIAYDKYYQSGLK